mmetsp:Transcript_4436/g.4448  ORF Transcript_4436/g.4448 Transcript_4436/m.4448 type:complete len:518 (-) Transcript_4436:2192-3745(-)
MVIRIQTNNAAAAGTGLNWTSAGGLTNTDFMLGLKNSHLNLVHSVAININNQDILQPQPFSNSYLIFRQHAELSYEDELLNAPLHGYCKDNSESWSFIAGTINNGIVTGTSKGAGICNNVNGTNAFAVDVNATSNEGLRRRHALIQKLGSVNGKATILGDLEANKPEGKNYIENIDGANGGKYIYYNVFLRLVDLMPDFFSNFPMSKGIKFKITLTLNNNVSFKFQKNAAGNLIFDPANFSNVTSATNPLMLSASYNTNVSPTAANTIAQIAVSNTITPSGCATLLAADANTYTVSMKIGKNNGVQGALTQCVLYCPVYRMNPTFEEKYFKENRIQKIHYTELEYQSFTAKTLNQFNVELSSTCVRPKRLIMIGVLPPAANYGIDPMSSPFASEPSTTSPFVLSAFNCAVSNNNLYPNDITYSYDNFLQNLNGQTGINSNLVKGLVSSRINLNDFQNNYHYIVVDLSRRPTSMDMVSNSIRVRGQIKSPLDIVFHCFIEKERVIEIDVMTGALLKRE